MAKYVDGFVIPIKKDNVKTYLKMAKLGYKLWMKYGALDYYECVGDHLDMPCGITFPKMCKLKPDETVIFAFIVYKSKTHRNQVNKQVMGDDLMKKMGPEMAPFNMKRFAMGGFKVLVSPK